MSERITDNISPTHDDVLEWGYDEDLYLMEQDEDLLLYGLYYVPALLELAKDPACPKQHYALCIIGQFTREAALHQRSDELHGLEQILNSFQASEPSVEDWRNYVRRLLSYQQRPFSVDEQGAWEMAQDLLIGIGRVGQVKMDSDKQPNAWHFSLVTSVHEHLSITKQTGVCSYQRTYPRT